MVKLIHLKNIGDNKGAVINLDFSGKPPIELPVFYRSKGANPEGHFHKGTDPSYDPQYIYVIKGSLEITCIDPNGDQKVLVLEERDMVVIPKMVYHKYLALEDTIFLEPRFEKYDINNVDKCTCSPQEYKELISKLL